jgi:hypothetical protein
LLKVDIEGADYLALKGCNRLFSERLVREVWFEQNKPRMGALGIPESAAQKFLASVGYRTFPMNDPADELVNWRGYPASF